MTILFVTHYIDEPVYLADRIIALTLPPTTVNEVVDVNLQRPHHQIETKGAPGLPSSRRCPHACLSGVCRIMMISQGSKNYAMPVMKGAVLSVHPIPEGPQSPAGILIEFDFDKPQVKIVHTGDRPQLVEMIAPLRGAYLHIYRAHSDFPIARLDVEHHAILAASVAREPERPAAAIREHPENTVEHVAAYL